MSHLRNLVVLEENSAATVVEVFLGADELSFTNAVTQAVLGENARLTHVKVQLEGRQAFHVGNLFLSHARGARSTSHVYSFGGATVRNEIAATLSGEGSGTELYGLFAAAAGQNVDCHTVIDHAAPRADSLELYKGILDGNGRGAFDGKVIVREGAVKTDARQTNRNLILSNEALVDSKPQLVIHNNDVRCSHGSTTGRIDADALFYLRSRGLSEGAARALLTYAFGSEVVSKVAAHGREGPPRGPPPRVAARSGRNGEPMSVVPETAIPGVSPAFDVERDPASNFRSSARPCTARRSSTSTTRTRRRSRAP